MTKPASAAATLAAPCPSLFSESGTLAQDLVEAYLAVRNETERRAAPLSPEDQLLQSMPGLGKVRAAQVMERLKISESRRVRGLGAKQVAALVAEFSAGE